MLSRRLFAAGAAGLAINGVKPEDVPSDVEL